MKKTSFKQILTVLLLIFAIFVAVRAQELKLEILNGHSGGGVLAVAVSNDGKFALTGSTDQTALLWDLEAGKQLRRFFGYHEDAISCVQFSKDGRFVLTASYDSSAQLWETATGKRVHGFGENRGGVLIKHSGKILSCAISNDMKTVATAGEDKTARIWDFETGKQLFELKHYGRVNSIAFSPDSTLLLTGGEDKIARLYSTANGKEERHLVGHTGVITSVAYSPDGKEILTIDHSKDISDAAFLWDAETGTVIRKIEAETLKELKDKLKDDEKTSKYKLSDEYELSGKAARIKPEGESAQVGKISISPDFSYIFIADAKTSVEWDIKNGKSEKAVRREDYEDRFDESKAHSPDGKTFAMTARDRKTIRLFDEETGRTKHILGEFFAPVRSVAFSPDGKTLATASGGAVDRSKVGIGNAAQANSVQFWDVETGKEIGRFGGDLKISNNKIPGFKSVAFSPDGKYTAAGSLDDEVYLRNNETGQLRQFEGHTDVVNSIKFAKDANGKLLVVSGSSDSTVRIWDEGSGEEICALVTFRDGNWAVVQTKTGRYDAPNGGEIDGIQWVFGNETIALSQLKDIYYAPNLLPRLLGYNKEPLREVPSLANLKLFPKIVEQKLDGANAKLIVKLQNRGGGIGAVRVSVNGKLATEDARDEKLRANPNAAEAVIIFNLKGSAGFRFERN